MSNVHYLNCPKCGMKYYISMELLHSGLSTICPRCHHEFAPSEGTRPSMGNGATKASKA